MLFNTTIKLQFLAAQPRLMVSVHQCMVKSLLNHCNDRKYYHVARALDSSTTCCVMGLLMNLLTDGKYDALKNQLLLLIQLSYP